MANPASSTQFIVRNNKATDGQARCIRIFERINEQRVDWLAAFDFIQTGGPFPCDDSDLWLDLLALKVHGPQYTIMMDMDLHRACIKDLAWAHTAPGQPHASPMSKKFVDIFSAAVCTRTALIRKIVQALCDEDYPTVKCRIHEIETILDSCLKMGPDDLQE